MVIAEDSRAVLSVLHVVAAVESRNAPSLGAGSSLQRLRKLDWCLLYWFCSWLFLKHAFLWLSVLMCAVDCIFWRFSSFSSSNLCSRFCGSLWCSSWYISSFCSGTFAAISVVAVRRLGMRNSISSPCSSSGSSSSSRLAVAAVFCSNSSFCSSSLAVAAVTAAALAAVFDSSFYSSSLAVAADAEAAALQFCSNFCSNFYSSSSNSSKQQQQ